MSKRRTRVWITKRFTPDIQKALTSKARWFARKFGGEAEEVYAEASALFVAACQKWDEGRGPVGKWVRFYVSKELMESAETKMRRHRLLPRTSNDVLHALTVEDPEPFVPAELNSRLDEDAAMDVRLVLETPKAMMRMLRTRRRQIRSAEPEEIGVRTVLRSYLQDLGWGLNRIRSTFGRIACALA